MTVWLMFLGMPGMAVTDTIVVNAHLRDLRLPSVRDLCVRPLRWGGTSQKRNVHD